MLQIWLKKFCESCPWVLLPLQSLEGGKLFLAEAWPRRCSCSSQQKLSASSPLWTWIKSMTFNYNFPCYLGWLCSCKNQWISKQTYQAFFSLKTVVHNHYLRFLAVSNTARSQNNNKNKKGKGRLLGAEVWFLFIVFASLCWETPLFLLDSNQFESNMHTNWCAILSLLFTIVLL